MIKAENVCVSYGTLNIIKDISFSAEEGQWLMVVGPNGAGKSTLLNAVAQNIKYTGDIYFRGRDLKKMKPRERAAKVGLLSQNHYVGYSYTVRDVVGMGRYAHGTGIFSKGKGDEASVERALSLTGMENLAESSVLTLSGGELQRAFLAQLIAQDPELLLLDEPANHLDLIYQKQVFSLISDWIRNSGRSVISVVHDLSLAKKFGTHALLMNKGVVAASGILEDVLTREALKEVYSMDVYEWMREISEQWRV